MRRRIAIAVSVVLCAVAARAAEPAEQLPKLVLQITVDQLRGDLPLRYQDRFGQGGFRYLLKKGTWYAAAHHSHSHTETIVGHGTLATGTQPSRHGLIGDKAFSEQTADDPDAGICSPPPADTGTTNSTTSTSVQSSEYEPVPGGATPESILTTTFSDELMLKYAGRSKVFGISWKDRAAVPMAGHTGKALWFSMSTGCFTSSTYYYTTFPQWMTDWCAKKPADQYRDVPWNLLYDKSTYVYRDQANQYPAGTPPEGNMQMLVGLQFGRTFPHKIATAGSYYDALSISPFADEFVAAFARELVQKEQLGKDAIPDYLAISFSATDLGGHWFGPSSLESEDNMLRLDRTLEQLFAFIDKEVGLKNTLIVLAGDHGMAEYPEYLKTLKVNTGRITMQDIQKAAEDALKKKYGVDGVIGQYSHPWFYLCENVMEANDIDPVEAQRVVARAVAALDGIALAIPNSDPRSPSVDVDDLHAILQVQHSYNARRSGDVYIVQRPHWQVDDASAQGPKFLSHGSPWAYDTYVPVAFAGAGVPAAMVHRGISTIDVAATLAAVLRTKFPSGCTGVPLSEVAGKR